MSSKHGGNNCPTEEIERIVKDGTPDEFVSLVFAISDCDNCLRQVKTLLNLKGV